MTFPHAIQTDRGEPSKIRIGTIDPLGQVLLQNTILENVGVLQGYTPIPGDTVAIVGQSAVGTSGASWLVLGRPRDIGLPTIRTVRVLLVGVSIPNGVVTDIAWEEADYDTDSFWNPAVPETFTMPFGGVFAFTFNAVFAASIGGGVRYIELSHNGNPIIRHRHPGIIGDSGEIGLAAEFEVIAGDPITFGAFQTSGAALDLEIAQATIRLVGHV